MRIRLSYALILAFIALVFPASTRAGAPPAYLPHYTVDLDFDLPGHVVRGHILATWTNPHPRATNHLVFNAHAHYFVPPKDIPLMAKTLEILRVNPNEALITGKAAFEIVKVSLPSSPTDPTQKPAPALELPFHFEGDTNTTLVVDVPMNVGQGQSVTIDLEFELDLPQKQGRWGQWRGVTFLSNWLPVFAVYGDPPANKPEPDANCGPEKPITDPCWQPTPFVPWHQPFFNESGFYKVRAKLPSEQKVACSGTIVAVRPIEYGRKEIEIQADGIRDFAFLCSSKYECYEGEVAIGADRPPVRIHVLANSTHAYYAKAMVEMAAEALRTYSRWFGPYPYADYTIAESFFGWNGNECSTLVMIDERVFGMPHLAKNYVEYLIYHETCHQWWYNLVGTNGYAETWMDEALATYFSNRMLNEVVGKNNEMMNYPAGFRWLPNIHREDYRSYGMYGTFGRKENAPAVQDMPKFGHLVNLFSNCYDKGARIAGMIEERLGPEQFLAFCKIVFQKYQYRILLVADFHKELEEFTKNNWDDFFRDWLYGKGLSDWAVDKVEILDRPCCIRRPWELAKRGQATGETKVVVMLSQRAEYSDPTWLGFALPGSSGYPIRVLIDVRHGSYQTDNPLTTVEVIDNNHVRVQITLPDVPTQVAVDPDQVLIDKDPSNNFWKPPIRVRIAPIYTFLEETDLTNAYDRWNLIAGPWIYGSGYDDPWFTRSTMLGARAAAYRTQEFDGGVYAAYRPDTHDIVAGFDALWSHWPDAHFQTGINAEERLTTFQTGRDQAFRGVVFTRYNLLYGSSLYLQPAHYIEAFTAYQDNFLPEAREVPPGAMRYNYESTLGLHYRLNYLTPYWDPEGGFLFDVVYEGGMTELDKRYGLHKVSAEFSTLFYLPDLSSQLDNMPVLYHFSRPFLQWLSETRVAVRAYGATAAPSQGLFYSLGGSLLFRGFDETQRQGSTVWVGSAEWRVPLAKGLTWDVADHMVGLRNIYAAAFYDVGDAYVNNHQVGSIAQAVGGGLRLDLAYFGFVERSMLRFDVAKTVNANTGLQFWFGIQHPF